MAWTEGLPGDFPGATVVGERAERALRMPFGMVSPLWAMFGAAAGMGVAYWWMTSWTRAVNVEAFAAFAPKLSPAPPIAEALTETEAAAVEAIAEAQEAVEPAVEAVAEPVLADVFEAPPAVEPEPEPEAAVEAAADDLTGMVGIGPKLAAALAERGVTRFAQIAAWGETELAEIDAALSLKGRAVREAWVAQARRLAGWN